MKSRFFKIELDAWGLLSAAGSLLCVFTICGFLGHLFWLLDEMAHFRVQYCLLLLVLALIYVAGRKFKPALIFICFAIVNAVIVAPYCLAGRNYAHPASSKIRIVLINVHTENQRYDLVVKYIRQNDPDVVVFEEVNDRWMQHLQTLQDSLPYLCAQPQSDNFGIALFSKVYLTNAQVRFLRSTEVPSVSAEIETGGKWILLIGTHPLPPSSADTTHLRDEQLAAVAQFVLDRKMPTIVVGDLNTTPWADSFHRFLKESRLTDSARGFGYQPTWPTMLPPMLIPLDHCLVSSNLYVMERRRGPDVGSDHYPVLVEVGIP